MTLQEINKAIRETRAEMKAKGIRRLSMMNGGHTSESMRLNERMFALETQKKQLAQAARVATREKSIDWSYPSSTNAAKLGFAAVGCWTVSVGEPDKPKTAVAGFADQADAIAYARSLPEPFGWLWRKYDQNAPTPINS